MKHKSILLLGLVVLLTNCTLTKRKYMPGYSVNWGHKAFVAMVNQKEPVYASNDNHNNQGNVARETYSFKQVLRADTDSLIGHNKDSYTRPQDNNKTKIIPQTSQQPSVIKVFYQPENEKDKNYQKQLRKNGDSDKDGFAFFGLLFAIVFFPLGLIFSIIGLRSQHKWLAIIGIVISCIWIIFIAGLIIFSIPIV